MPRDEAGDSIADGLIGRSAARSRWDALVDHHPDPMYQLDPDGTIVAANAALRALTGVEDACGRDLGILLDSEGRDRLVAELAELPAGRSRSYDLHGRLLSGQHPALRIIHVPVAIHGGTLGVLGIVRDLTEQRVAERARMLSDARWRGLFESSGAGVSVTDFAGRYLDANPAFCELVGYTADELRRMNVPAITHPDDLERNQQLIDELVRGARSSFVLEKRYLTKQGSTVWARLRAAAIHTPDGEPLHLVATVEDITSRKEAEDRLERSRSLLRIAGRKARLGGWAIDAATRELTWSDEIFEILERAPGSPPPLDDAIDAYLPADRRRIRDAVETCLRDGTPFDLEADLLTFGGRPVRVRVTAEARRDDDGQVREVIGAFQDISELAAAHERSAEIADQLTTTLESMTDALCIIDDEWRFTYLNGRAAELLQRDRGELVGATIWDEFAGVAGTELETAFRRAMEQQTTEVLDPYHYVALSRWFRVHAYPSDRALTVYFQDVTEQQRTRVVLAEREARLMQQAALLDNARDAIMVWDLDGRIGYWNRRAARLYGWDADEVVGHTVRDLLFTDVQAFDAATTATLEDGEWVGELAQHTRDGRELTVEARWTLVRHDDDASPSVMAINTDVTERKRLEAQFLRAQRMESLGTLAGGIAHDLNNVLAPILMSTELLTHDEEDERRLELLRTIESSTQRGADMIRQVLSFARGVEGVHRELDPAALLADVNRILRDTLPRNIALHSEVPAEVLWGVAGEATQLHQVLVNLAVNARDAMPDGGTLRFGADNVMIDEAYAAMTHDARPGAYVRIEVEDDGVGMPAETIDRIFEPFFTTKPHGAGTGLGLSTSLAIVTSHGGFLRVYSEPGAGTTFALYLPAVSARAPTDRGLPGRELPRGSGEVVLVVDDEAAVRQITRQTLEAHGYEVFEAMDGAEAVSVFAEHHRDIDLVLTDMMMPIMDGTAAIAALRRIDPGVTIVAASGLSNSGRIASDEAAGVRAFLPKPYTADALLTALRDALDRAG